MEWSMPINPLNNIYLSAAVAAIPILFLFWALAVKRMKGHWTSIGATAIAILIAAFVYGMPVKLAALATLNGMMFGLWPIIWIVLCAVFLYNLSVETGQFEIIKNSLASITDDRRLQTLLIAFSFGAFLEGAAGFGTPVAIAGAMLMGLGFHPLYAAGLCLVANTAPVAFGGIGVPVVVAGQVSGIDQLAISQMIGRTLPVLGLLIPAYLVMLMAGFRRGLEVWPAVLVCGGSFALTQWLTAEFLGPMLPDIIAAITSIVALTVFLRFWHPKNSWRFEGEAVGQGKEKLRYSVGQVFRAWAPFVILSLMVGAWGIKPVKAALDHVSLFKIPMAGLDQMVIRDGKPMAAVFSFNILSAAGTAILFAALFSLPIMGANLATAGRVFVRTLKTLKFSILSVSFILGFAYIMNFSGMAITLGNAFVGTGPAFLFFSPFLGWLGVFMTGSDTSANALFGKLQEVTATKLGINPVIAVAANTSGGGCGKMISPQSLSVATAATNQVGKEADIFRFTLKHSIVLTSIVAVVVFLQSNALFWLVPAYAKGSATAPGVATAPPLQEGVMYLLGNLALIAIVTVSSRIVGKKALSESKEGSENAAA